PHRSRARAGVPRRHRRRRRRARADAGGSQRAVAALCVRARAARMTPRDPRIDVREIESLRAELERRVHDLAPPRWNADPEDVQRSAARLVLTLADLLRQLMERQAIRRMEAQTRTPAATER